VSGTFGTVGTNLAFLTPSVSYDSHDAFLQLERNGTTFPSVGVTPNQVAAGDGVTSTGTASALAAALLPLDTGTARSALTQLAGDIHPSLRSSLIDDSHFVRDAAVNRLRSAFGVGSAGAAPLAADTRSDVGADAQGTTQAGPNGVAEAAGVPATGTAGALPVAHDRGTSVWSYTFGAWTRTQSDGNASSLSDATSGELVGVDTGIGNGWRVGGLAGVSFNKLDSSTGTSNLDNYHLGLYAGRQWERLGLRLGGAYSWHSIDTSRNVAFGSFANHLSSSYDGGTAQVFGELGYRLEAGRYAFEPYADLAYVRLHTDGFNESGGAAALSGAGDSSGTTLSTLGLRASTAFAIGRVAANASAAVGWRHAWGAVATQTDVRFAGGDVFEVGGLPLDRDVATLDLGMDFVLSRNVSARVAYAGQYGARYQQHAIQGKVAWVF
jgi:fibronectin-binding autotransporter adhesin